MRRSKIAFIGLLAAALAAVVLVAVVALLPGGSEPLTAARLETARQRWRAAGIRNYEMELETSGAQTGRYVVRVKDGSVVSLARDGHVENPSEKELWSVDGLFRTLERELGNAEHPEKIYGVAPGTQVLLRMRSDPRLGYPLFFSRYVMGTNKSVTIRTVRLTPLGRSH